MTIDSKKWLVVIGTSGSPDYLKDTSDRRFWPICVKGTADDDYCNRIARRSEQACRS